ncbi:MAG: flavodoxin domain-containing protein, partial [Pseudomonadota bacterium]
MNILFGSVTGTAENLARDAAQKARDRGHTVNLSELDEVSMDDLAEMDDVLVVISTYGEGEMPFNAEMFWDELETDEPVLEGLTYGVLALGDTAYEMFCQAGKDIDARLEELGATRRIDRVDCDLNYERDAAAWIDRAIPTQDGAAPVPAAATQTAEPEAKRWSRSNPFAAKVVDRRLLSGEGSTKEIHHIALSIEGSGIDYAAGDSIAVIPTNPPHLVDAFLERLGGTADEIVEGYDLPLGELLASKFEITTPPDLLLKGVASVIDDYEIHDAVIDGDK